MIDVKIAELEEERTACYKLRYQSYSKLGRVAFNNQGVLIDSFDSDDLSVMFMAFFNGSLTGTMRITRENDKGFLMSPLFKEEILSIKHEGSRIYEISRAMVEGVNTFSVHLGLINGIYLFALKQDISDYVFQIHPKDIRMYEKIGIYPMGETKFYVSVNDLAVPMRWEINSTNKRYEELFLDNKRVRCHF